MTADAYARLDATHLLDTLLPRLTQTAHGNEPATAGSPLVWACSPLRGTALSETQIKDLQITQPNGPAVLGLAVPQAAR